MAADFKVPIMGSTWNFLQFGCLPVPRYDHNTYGQCIKESMLEANKNGLSNKGYTRL
jgi:hypothetical protein